MSRHILYLICYDICDPKRLARVARYLSGVGHRVQYSVFAAELTKRGLDAVLADLEQIIDTREDDVRAYPLPPAGDVAMLGRQIFPDGVMLLRDGRNLLRLSSTRRSAAA